MPGHVSCRLYLLLDVLENFDISLDLRSRDIKFSNSSQSKYNRQVTHSVIIFYMYLTRGKTNTENKNVANLALSYYLPWPFGT